MSDTTQAQEATEAQEAQTSEVTTAATQEAAAETFDRTYVEGLRKEAAANRKRLRELEQKVKEEDDKKLSEQEKLAKRTQELEAEHATLAASLRQERSKSAVLAVVAKMPGINPDLVLDLLPANKLEYDEDGQPKEVKALVEKLVKKYNLAAAVASGSAGNPARGAQSARAEEAPEVRRARLYGVGAANLFDPKQAQQYGGGIVGPESEE